MKVPPIQRYEPMKGITQTPARDTVIRPPQGLPRMSAEEERINNLLEYWGAEQFVQRNWELFSPQRIADAFNVAHNISWMTPKWVQSIHQRLDGGKSLRAKE